MRAGSAVRLAVWVGMLLATPFLVTVSIRPIEAALETASPAHAATAIGVLVATLLPVSTIIVGGIDLARGRLHSGGRMLIVALVTGFTNYGIGTAVAGLAVPTLHTTGDAVVWLAAFIFAVIAWFEVLSAVYWVCTVDLALHLRLYRLIEARIRGARSRRYDY